MTTLGAEPGGSANRQLSISLAAFREPFLKWSVAKSGAPALVPLALPHKHSLHAAIGGKLYGDAGRDCGFAHSARPLGLPVRCLLLLEALWVVVLLGE
jgi:hypothetical protein